MQLFLDFLGCQGVGGRYQSVALPSDRLYDISLAAQPLHMLPDRSTGNPQEPTQLFSRDENPLTSLQST